MVGDPAFRAWLGREARRVTGRGAGDAAMAAIDVFARAAARLGTDSPAGFRRRLLGVARFLAAQRPTMVPVRNGLNQVMAAAMAAPRPQEARRAARQSARLFVAELQRARKRLAERGARALRNDGAILTHCYSTAVIRTLARLPKRRRLRVFVTETRPSRQGL